VKLTDRLTRHVREVAVFERDLSLDGFLGHSGRRRLVQGAWKCTDIYVCNFTRQNTRPLPTSCQTAVVQIWK